jgi:uncharacterized caspase-like protein
LQAAGFDVVGARDLDQDSLRRAFRDFLDKATSAGPDTFAFIYLSGYGLQLEGENYFVPIDARIARDADVPAEALRLSDYTRPLAALRLKASVVVLDGARQNPFARSGPPLAGGLALVDPEPGVLIAFNAAPSTVAPDEQGPYGAYAQALAEMMREGGLPLADVFDRTRLRVNDMTKGAEVPWHASKLPTQVMFFERAPDAPPPDVSPDQTAAIMARPIRDFGAQDAYIAALERDTMQGYLDFLDAYPDAPMSKRVRAIVAARREAITWRRTRSVDTPPAYWSYLRRYPRGPHADDARRRLAFLSQALEPPPDFAVIVYDVPPPPPEEIIYVDRPVIVFDDPVYALPPPPPPAIIFLPPPPPEFIVLEPPPPPVGVYILPIPVYQPVPLWVRPPRYVAPPPNNIIYQNIHNTVIVNNATNQVTIRERGGRERTLAPPPPPPPASGRAGAPAPAVTSIGPALPPSVQQKANILQNQQGGSGAPGPQPRGPQPPPNQQQPPLGQPLPGVGGQPLPKGGARDAADQRLRQQQQQQQQQGQPNVQPLPKGALPKGTVPKGNGQPLPKGAGQPLPKGPEPLPKGASPDVEQRRLQQQQQQQQQQGRPQLKQEPQLKQQPQPQIKQQAPTPPQPAPKQIDQRQIQLEQQRQHQIEQQRQQQQQQQQRQQQIQQQQQQQRQQQIQQQQQQLRQQQIQQQQQQQRQQQIQQKQVHPQPQPAAPPRQPPPPPPPPAQRQPPAKQPPPNCGHPGQPACPK